MGKLLNYWYQTDYLKLGKSILKVNQYQHFISHQFFIVI